MSSLLDIILLQGGFIQQFIEWIINNGGLYFLLFVIFAETGLLVGFFLPGDSLLFTVGVVAGAGGLNIFVVNIVLAAAAMIGDTTGYLLGRTTGQRIFNRPDSRLFKRE